MGFMGLSSWVESDCAADFRGTLQKQFADFDQHEDEKLLKTAIRRCVDEELADMANEYNTPGYTNLALVLEDEGDPGDPKYDDPGLPVFSKFLTVAQLKRASRLFLKDSNDWRTKHKHRLNQLHKVIITLLKSRRAKQ